MSVAHSKVMQRSFTAMRRPHTTWRHPLASLHCLGQSASYSSDARPPSQQMASPGSDASPAAKPSWQRQAWARTKLTVDEWQERCAELRTELPERSSFWLQQQRVRCGSFSANDFIERSHYKWIAANRRFDDWFNAQWPIWHAELRRRCGELPQKIRDGKLTESQPQKGKSSVDVPAMLLLGAGMGSVAQGWAAAGVLFTVWGTVRGVSRFVIQKVDAEDLQGLFRWAPASWGPARRAKIFNRLQHEIHVSRKIREGDPHYTTYHHSGGDRHKAMDPLNDYTPEKLFDDTMKSVAVHPRVLESIGGEVQDASEPDKVVYRIVEGIAEVYLSFHITGPSTGAEIQVKATACLLDYIYVFPETSNKYQMPPPAFVIKPYGDWSKNADEMGRYMKSPFGKEGDSQKLYTNKSRSGVFEYDWTVRDFKHGKEDRFAGRWR